ncbi:MAG TPA: DUF2516 family protein [Pseudonocardiaceae bacterium]|nr:DUF2516 family protein [Pseudonocardiaceae bacterium]
MTITGWIVTVLNWAAVPVGLFAFLHAAVQRSDAYSAANKRTKPVWLAITGGGTLACFLFHFYDFTLMFWIAGLVAVLVYIVDVRPKLIEVQRGGQKW